MAKPTGLQFEPIGIIMEHTAREGLASWFTSSTVDLL